MQVAKWGNSLAVRLPASVVEALKLKEGDDVEIHLLRFHSAGRGVEGSNHNLLLFVSLTVASD